MRQRSSIRCVTRRLDFGICMVAVASSLGGGRGEVGCASSGDAGEGSGWQGGASGAWIKSQLLKLS